MSSAEQISKLEALLARVSERRGAPQTRLRIVGKGASASAPVAEPASDGAVVEVAAEATLRDRTPKPAAVVAKPVVEGVSANPNDQGPEAVEGAEAPVPEEPIEVDVEDVASVPPSEPEVAEIEISEGDLEALDEAAEVGVEAPETEAAPQDEEELVVEEVSKSPAEPPAQPRAAEEAALQTKSEAIPPTKVTIDAPVTTDSVTTRRPDTVDSAPVPGQHTQIGGISSDAMAAKPLGVTGRQAEPTPSKSIELAQRAELPAQSEEVSVAIPAAPTPAPTLDALAPAVIDPPRMPRDDVADFVTEAKSLPSGSFGELIDAALELGF